MTEKKPHAGEAARVTRSDWNRKARRACIEIQKRRKEENARLEREGGRPDYGEKLYVILHFSPLSAAPWAAKVISGLGEVEGRLIGDQMEAKATTQDGAIRALHRTFLKQLVRAHIMGPDDAQVRARKVEFVVMDKIGGD